jgi:hypothetical protein
LNKFLNAVNFGAVKSLVTLKTNRLKPEFSDLSISFNMDVRWLRSDRLRSKRIDMGQRSTAWAFKSFALNTSNIAECLADCQSVNMLV